MQSKLTLRMDDAVIRKAKRIAKKRGKSVSKILSDYIAKEKDDTIANDLPQITSSMIGILAKSNQEVDEEVHKKYLEDKYL